MLRPNQMPTQVEQIGHGSMGNHESLSLSNGLKSPHPSLPRPGCLVGLLRPVVRVLISDVDGFGN